MRPRTAINSNKVPQFIIGLKRYFFTAEIYCLYCGVLFGLKSELRCNSLKLNKMELASVKLKDMIRAVSKPAFTTHLLY